MLRGMGWDGNLDDKTRVKSKNELANGNKPRARLLGLGAEPAPILQKIKQFIKPGEKRESK